MIRFVLEKLRDGEVLEEAEAFHVLTSLLRDQFESEQVAALLALIEGRGLALSELSGFVGALTELGDKLNLTGDALVDVCGTGGDGKDTFNISTTSAFVAAAAGAQVVKHGNYSASSSCGASNVLEAAGIELSRDRDVLNANLEKFGICFLHAPFFQPLLKSVASVRRKIGIRTAFNVLGPLLNPARPQHQLIGLANLHTFRLYNIFLEKQGRSFLLVHSVDGYDEISLTGRFLVKGSEYEASFEPEELDLPRCSPESLKGGATHDEAVGIMESILSGRGTLEQSAVVIANAAFALLACNQREGNIREYISLCRKALESGRAHQLYNSLRSRAE